VTSNPEAIPLLSETLDDVFTWWSLPEGARMDIRQAVAALVAEDRSRLHLADDIRAGRLS
jgi:hypothetical protein